MKRCNFERDCGDWLYICQLKPFLRGRDVKRWKVNYADYYLIKIESSQNKKHPWSDLEAKDAEEIFRKTYPAIYNHFNNFREELIKRTDQGKYFWELRACAYWDEFEEPKIIMGRFMDHAEYAFDNYKSYHHNHFQSPLYYPLYNTSQILKYIHQ